LQASENYRRKIEFSIQIEYFDFQAISDIKIYTCEVFVSVHEVSSLHKKVGEFLNQGKLLSLNGDKNM